MADYRVNLEIFAGPMDLLLHLVRKEEVDIYDIPISKITDQYVRYIEMLKQLDIDVAGGFVVMAATLMQIKSAMLLPRSQGEELGAEDLADPRAELIRQLLEYKRFKDAANLLAAAADEQGEKFTRPDTVVEQLKGDSEPAVDLDRLSVWDLLEAFDKMMEATGAKFDISHITDDTPIDLYQIEILHRLQAEGPLSFERIFENRGNRLTLIGLFLAILELIRSQLVSAEFPASGAADGPEVTKSIYLRAMTDEPAESAVRKAILAVELVSASAQTPEPDKQELPIPIQEIPPAQESLPRPVQDTAPPIPISELPSDNAGKPPVTELESMAGESDKQD